MEPLEHPFADLVEQQQDLIVRFSPEGRLQYVNPAYCELVGKTREELHNGIFMPVTERQYSDVIATQMVKLFRPPYVCYVDQWMQTKNGLRCISWSARSIRNREGVVQSIVATGRDITAAKRQERAIARRDRQLMLVIESGTRMYYSHGPDHHLDYVSPRIRALLGYRPRSGKRMWTDYLSDNPANSSGLERTLRALSSGRREPPYRLEFVREDGSRIWVEVNEIPVFTEGRAVAIVGSLIDITERKQVEEGLEEAEILIKASRSNRNGTQDPGQPRQSPLGLFRSVLSRKESDAGEGLAGDGDAGTARE